MQTHTCCFIGHSECYGLSEEWVRDAIEDLINQGVTGFLCGGMGNFDWMCARLTCGLKREHPPCPLRPGDPVSDLLRVGTEVL